MAAEVQAIRCDSPEIPEAPGFLWKIVMKYSGKKVLDLPCGRGAEPLMINPKLKVVVVWEKN